MHSPNNFRLAAMFCWLAAGCEKTPDEVISTNQTISSIEEPPSDRPLNMDEEFLAIAKVAPGFGGAFLDNGSMKVVVATSTRPGIASKSG